MKNRMKILVPLFLVMISLTWVACTETGSEKEKMSQFEGVLKLGVEESVTPTFREIVKVYDSSFPKVEVQVDYDLEAQLIESLMKDSLKIIIITRDVTEQEKVYSEQNRFVLKSMAIAKDAIAVIGHPENMDSMMRVSQLKSILEGTFARSYKVVINSSRGSIARYISDEVLDKNSWSEQVYSEESYEDIIDFVNNNKNSIGILPVNYLYSGESNEDMPVFREDVNVVPLYNDSINKFVLPYQAYIALEDYPLTRTIYFVNRDNRQVPSAGFANFLTSEPAQLLFKKAMFVPLKSQLILRPVEIK